MSTLRPANADALAKVEAIIEDIAHNLSREDPISISLKHVKNVPTSPAPSQPSHDFAFKRLDDFFLGSKQSQARRFTILLRILDLIHEALTKNTVITKRYIYYNDASLFGSQRTVDRYVDILAYTLGVLRCNLNVTAVAKGLVMGSFTVVKSDGTRITHGLDDTTQLIDDSSEVQAVDTIGVSWILVVEKESIFRMLASNKLHFNSRAGKGIILTSKGYPDLSSRLFLSLLEENGRTQTSPPPIYALTDFDPDGIAIMSTYKHGSRQLHHENPHLKVLSIRWLGIKSRDVFNIVSGSEKIEGRLRLSTRNRKKGNNLLGNNPAFAEDGPEKEWRRELQVMLMSNVKAEIEILEEREGGILQWVEEKLLEDR